IASSNVKTSSAEIAASRCQSSNSIFRTLFDHRIKSCPQDASSWRKSRNGGVIYRGRIFTPKDSAKSTTITTRHHQHHHQPNQDSCDPEDSNQGQSNTAANSDTTYSTS